MTRTAGALRLVREDRWPCVLRLLRVTGDADLADALEGARSSRSREELFPEPLIASEDLARLEIPRGKRWGELLREAEDLQLEGRLRTREDALSWLRGRKS